MNFILRMFCIMKMEQNTDKAYIITKKTKQDQSKKKKKIHHLYQEVIQKNFQTISDLLKKLTVLTTSTSMKYPEHQEIQQEFLIISKRMTKFQSDLQSIHNEHRRDNLHLFSNISEIRTQIAGIDAHIKLLFADLKLKKSNEKDGAKKSFLVNKSKSLYILNNQQSDDGTINNFPLEEQIQIAQQIQNSLKRDSSRKDHLSIKEIKNNRIQEYSELSQPLYLKINQYNYSQQTRKTNKYLSCAIPKQSENMKENFTDKRLSQNNNLMREQDFVSSLPSNQEEEIVESYPRHKRKQKRTILQNYEDGQYLNYQIKHQLRNVEQNNIPTDPANSLLSQNRTLVLPKEGYILSFDRYNQIKIEQQRMYDNLSKGIELIQVKLQENERKMLEGRRYYDQKMQKIQPQILFIQEKCQRFVTKDTLNNETFKLIEKHKQNWEDCYYFFAHKQETKNALQFLQQRLKYFIQNQNQKGISQQYIQNKQSKQKVREVIETKCLCCTRSIAKKNYHKIDLSAMRNTTNSLQATTKRLKPSQLKKRTVELLNRTRKQISRSTHHEQ